MELRAGHIRKHKAVKGQLSNRTYGLIESDKPSLAAQAHAMLCIIVLIRFGSLLGQSAFDEFDRIPGASERIKMLKILRVSNRCVVLHHAQSPSGMVLWIRCSTARSWTNPFTVEAKGLNYLACVSVTGSTTLTPRSLWSWRAQISECGNILLSFLCGHVYCWVWIPTTKARQTLSCVRNHSRPLPSKYLPS